jgi:sugar lactone lactonase YvrE
MNQRFALPALAVLALTVSAGVLIARAAEHPAAPYPPGTIITVAGTGKEGFSGDGGPATQAALDHPWDQVVDAAGNLLIVDGDNHRIRKVGQDGIITTVAGSGPVGYGKGGFSGDGGPAFQARLYDPAGAIIDPTGGLLIADWTNNRVRRVDPAGIITTIAGNGKPGFSGDGGPATAARLNGPFQLALDSQGNLYIADGGNNRVRKVSLDGIITTVAGGGHPADGRGDGGLATQARLRFLIGVCVDPAGNLFVTDFPDGRVRKVSTDGTISTVAGGGHPADGVGDGGPATEARLDGPYFITLDAGGNLFIAENRGERIRKVSPAGLITTVAGTGQIGYTGDGGPATAAQLNSPNGIAVDRAGNVFFTEAERATPNVAGERQGNMVVREVIGVAVPG